MTSPARSFEVYAFDAYGTLFDVHSAVERVTAESRELGRRLSELWRRRQLEYSWVRTLTGRYLDFWTLTEQALDFALAALGIDDPRLREELLASYGELEAYPDAAETLSTLRAAGRRIAILTNGTESMTRASLRAAGLEASVDELVSAHEVRRFKTDAAVYEALRARLGVETGAVSFQSANRWDVAGAVAFGFRGVWVRRDDAPEEYDDLAPDRVVRALSELIDERS